jgi:hypothetical protein
VRVIEHRGSSIGLKRQRTRRRNDIELGIANNPDGGRIDPRLQLETFGDLAS